MAGFTIWIVSIDTEEEERRHHAQAAPAERGLHAQGKAKVREVVDKKADFVGAIVFYDDPSESSVQYAPYTLTVNGVVQPGGS